jgi:hypothetical protein
MVLFLEFLFGVLILLLLEVQAGIAPPWNFFLRLGSIQLQTLDYTKAGFL